jgi:hypothetical protein
VDKLPLMSCLLGNDGIAAKDRVKLIAMVNDAIPPPAGARERLTGMIDKWRAKDTFGFISYQPVGGEGRGAGDRGGSCQAGSGGGCGRRRVCTYWLGGSCHKGELCTFLHTHEPQHQPVFCPINHVRCGFLDSDQRRKFLQPGYKVTFLLMPSQRHPGQFEAHDVAVVEEDVAMYGARSYTVFRA